MLKHVRGFSKGQNSKKSSSCYINCYLFIYVVIYYPRAITDNKIDLLYPHLLSACENYSLWLQYFFESQPSSTYNILTSLYRIDGVLNDLSNKNYFFLHSFTLPFNLQHIKLA